LLVTFPSISSTFAMFVGVGRGSDFILYISVVLLFYLIFRLYIYMEDIRRDISELVQKMALKESKSKHAKKTTKN
jgi:hypothetical protein